MTDELLVFPVGGFWKLASAREGPLFRTSNARVMRSGNSAAPRQIGTLSVARSWKTNDTEPMSDDPDFPKANHALRVLRQARLSRSEAAAIMLADLVYDTAGTGEGSPEIEEARQAAWVAISDLAKTLKEEGFAPPSLWKAALGATETWVELLD